MDHIISLISTEISPTLDLNIGRCTASHRTCAFRSCAVTKNLRNIDRRVRKKMLQDHRFYIPSEARACVIHYESKAWNDLNNFGEAKKTYKKRQIEDMVDLLRSQDTPNDGLNVDCFTSDMKIATGLDAKQFQELFDSIPLLQTKYKDNISRARSALYTYMLRLRTGQTLEQIASGLRKSHTTVIRRLNTVREVLIKHFVPPQLNSICARNQLLANTSEMSRILYCNSDTDKVVLVLDGTYIYIENSGNQSFQKKTYTQQKKRNFIKIMMCVTTNGKIVFVSGPYAAVENDAKILNTILDKNKCHVFSQLQPGDVCLVDRGFRDCVEVLKSKLLDVRIPECIPKQKKQLTTMQANRSRLVTKCRYVVEARNGHMKCVWRMFKMVWTTKALPHLMDDFRIGAALLNKFFRNILTDKNLSAEVANRMLQRSHEPNKIAKIIDQATFQSNLKTFQSVDNFDMFPEMTEDDLFLFALGVYQIAQARNYCTRHLTENGGRFVCYVCPRDICLRYFESLATEQSQLNLFYIQLLSRHVNNSTYRTYLLIDSNKVGNQCVIGYYCGCKIGSRTVGCCSHVMCMIWYLGPIHKVAGFLDNFLDNSSSEEED